MHISIFMLVHLIYEYIHIYYREAMKGTPLTSEQNTYYLNYFALFSMVGVAGLTLRALVLAQHRLGMNIIVCLNRSMSVNYCAFFSMVGVLQLTSRASIQYASPRNVLLRICVIFRNFVFVISTDIL
jgi:hypothetical protein